MWFKVLKIMAYLSREARLNRLNDEICSKSQGTAKVDLNSLKFGKKEPDKDNVNRLMNIYKLEGCNRSNPLHFIPGDISEEVLQASLNLSNLTIDDLRSSEPPTLYLPPGTQVTCLNGHHRVAALRESRYLHPWWTIRLYVGKGCNQIY
jgi:hypothetical protein